MTGLEVVCVAATCDVEALLLRNAMNGASLKSK